MVSGWVVSIAHQSTVPINKFQSQWNQNIAWTSVKESSQICSHTTPKPCSYQYSCVSAFGTGQTSSSPCNVQAGIYQRPSQLELYSGFLHDGPFVDIEAFVFSHRDVRVCSIVARNNHILFNSPLTQPDWSHPVSVTWLNIFTMRQLENSKDMLIGNCFEILIVFLKGTCMHSQKKFMGPITATKIVILINLPHYAFLSTNFHAVCNIPVWECKRSAKF